jgi:hypothetical protein
MANAKLWAIADFSKWPDADGTVFLFSKSGAEGQAAE